MSGGEPSSIKQTVSCAAVSLMSVYRYASVPHKSVLCLFLLADLLGGIALSDYQVLYRKWRPRVFDDVYGQPQVTVTLKNQLKTGRIAHAFLFTGSRGTGKTTCAKILAKAVNCLDPIDGEPCNKCAVCQGIDNESILDVVEMDAASNNGVDDIRDLRSELTYTPAVAKYRVYIIDEVHMLSVNAFNALLKTLEEPPSYAVFILATTDIHKLPPTIISRCQRFDFNRIAPNKICERLKYVASKEQFELTDDGAMLIARLSDGGMRDALSLLDQCMGAGKTVDENVVSSVAGLTGKDHLFSIADAVKKGETEAVLSTINSLYSASADMTRLTEELASHFRNLLVLKSVKDARDCLAVTNDEAEKLKAQSDMFSAQFIIHCINSLSTSLERMARGTNRRTELELCLIRLCNPRLDNDVDALSRRIAALEDKLKQGTFISGAMPTANVNTTADEASKSSQTAAVQNRTVPSADDAVLIENWQEIVEELRAGCIPLYSALRNSTGYEKDGFVFVDCSPSGKEMLRTKSFRESLRKVLRDKLGGDYRLGPYEPQNSPKNRTEENALDMLEKMASDAGIPIN